MYVSKMAYLFVVKESGVLYLKTVMTQTRSDVFVHKYDNGCLITFDDWSDYTIAKLMLRDKRVFCQPLSGTFW